MNESPKKYKLSTTKIIGVVAALLCALASVAFMMLGKQLDPSSRDALFLLALGLIVLHGIKE